MFILKEEIMWVSGLYVTGKKVRLKISASGRLLALVRIFAFNWGLRINDGVRNPPTVQIKRNRAENMMNGILNSVFLLLEMLSCMVIFCAWC